MYMYVCISVRGAGGCSYQSISPAGARAQQQTRRTPLLLSIDGTDGQTDGRTDTRPFYVAYRILRGPCNSSAYHVYRHIISRQVASLRAGLMPMIM